MMFGRAFLGVALALVVVGGVQAQTPVPISIYVTTDFKPVDGLKLTSFGLPAHITGRVLNALAGASVVLQGNKFPFAGFATVHHAVTGDGGTYRFSVKPVLATYYRVVLASDHTSKSSTVTEYVSHYVEPTSRSFCPNNRTPGASCYLRYKGVVVVPAAVAAQEGAKLAYFYFDINYGTSPQKGLIALRQTGRQHRMSGYGPYTYPSAHARFSSSFTATFTTNYGRLSTTAVICVKDTEPTDGLGLPGHHGCGDPSINPTRHYAG